MAITSVATALAQYNDNLDWETSEDKARLALQAIRYLIVNQPESYSIGGQAVTKNLPHLMSEKAKLEAFVGAAYPRANGRARCVYPANRSNPEGADVIV